MLWMSIRGHKDRHPRLHALFGIRASTGDWRNDHPVKCTLSEYEEQSLKLQYPHKYQVWVVAHLEFQDSVGRVTQSKLVS